MVSVSCAKSSHGLLHAIVRWVFVTIGGVCMCNGGQSNDPDGSAQRGGGYRERQLAKFVQFYSGCPSQLFTGRWVDLVNLGMSLGVSGCSSTILCAKPEERG